MESLVIMQRLAATNARNEKEQILIDAFMQGSDEFFTAIKLALDPLITFGQKKIAEIVDEDDSPGTIVFQEFMDLAKKLRARELTGHAARDAIHDMANRCHAQTWNKFYRRILLKDLGVGIDESTVNKILKKLSATNPKADSFIIPVFKCQLSHDGEDDAHRKKIKGKKLIDTKLDGCRILALMNKDTETVTLMSRNGQVVDSIPEIITDLEMVLRRLPGSVVLDGELMSPNGFAHLMTMLRRKDKHPETGLVRYALFDIVPMGDFFNGFCKTTQRDRRGILEAMTMEGMFSVDRKSIYIVPQIEVDLDTEEGCGAFNAFNRQVIDDGFEGIMIKDPEAPYEGKRTTAWLKKKPVIEVTLEIVGFMPGDPDGKYANTLGAIAMAGHDLGVDIETNVSGGISDDLRDEIWRNKSDYMGLTTEVVADKLTLEKNATVYSLRFARLKGFRGRIPGEKM